MPDSGWPGTRPGTTSAGEIAVHFSPEICQDTLARSPVFGTIRLGSPFFTDDTDDGSGTCKMFLASAHGTFRTAGFRPYHGRGPALVLDVERRGGDVVSGGIQGKLQSLGPDNPNNRLRRPADRSIHMIVPRTTPSPAVTGSLPLGGRQARAVEPPPPPTRWGRSVGESRQARETSARLRQKSSRFSSVLSSNFVECIGRPWPSGGCTATIQGTASGRGGGSRFRPFQRGRLESAAVLLPESDDRWSRFS